jgi:Trypsin
MCQEDRFDVAWVELASDFSLARGYVPPIASQAEWSEAMASETMITVAGFGATAAGGSGDGLKRAVATKITKLSEGGLEFYAGGDGKDSCDGDSGGPAFTRLEGGSLRLVGLVSRGAENCGVGGIYSTPYPALCTMREQTGVDLTAPGCDQCDCIDLHGDSSGCGVGGKGPRHDAWLVALLAAWAWIRPRSVRG